MIDHPVDKHGQVKLVRHQTRVEAPVDEKKGRSKQTNEEPKHTKKVPKDAIGRQTVPRKRAWKNCLSRGDAFGLSSLDVARGTFSEASVCLSHCKNKDVGKGIMWLSTESSVNPKHEHQDEHEDEVEPQASHTCGVCWAQVWLPCSELGYALLLTLICIIDL